MRDDAAGAQTPPSGIGATPGARFRFLLVNALDGRFAQFLYPTNAPQGLLAIEAGLKAYFPEVETRFLSWDHLPRSGALERFGALLRRFAPDAVGISTYSNAVPLAMQIALRVRAVTPDAPVIVGGVHPSAFPEGLDRYPMFDYYVRGEGVRICASLLRTIFLGEGTLDAIPSLSFKRDGETVLTEPERLPADMDKNPPIDWSRLRLKKKREYDIVRLDEDCCLFLDEGPMYPYESSQGCNKHCRFCERVNGSTFRAYSAQRVASDIVAIKNAIDVQLVFFNDENIHCNPYHLRSLLDALHDIRHLGIRYYMAVRAGEIDEYLIDQMIDVGVGLLHVFPESGSARIRDLMCKDINMATWMRNVRYASQRGLFILGGFIAGWPTETAEELHMSYELARDPVFDFVYLPALRCLARTDLKVHLDAHGIEPDTREYFEHLSFAKQLVVADYPPATYKAYLDRFVAVNKTKTATQQTKEKLSRLACRIENHPF